MKKWGALFDWDGVILDSTVWHEKSWQRLAEETGRSLPPGHFRRGYGMKNEWIIPEILGWTRDSEEIRRLSLRKEEIFRELALKGGVQPLPGVREWIEELHRHGIPRAIASSTHRENIVQLLPRLGLREFAGIIAAEDVSRGKPDPEVFVLAARVLGFSPQRCIIFEDTHAGIAAARSAGARVIAVSTTHPADTLWEADLVVSRLDELRVADLDEWFDEDESP
jgi:HAD superfamily hydrolase (TIGR01509 family)